MSEASQFYQQFIPKCCSKSTLFCFPDSSEKNATANWSLYRFGPANYYRKDTGITQEGFITGHNSLSLFTFVKPADLFAPAYMIDTKGFSLGGLLEISRKYRGKQTELLKLHPSDLFKFLGISNPQKSKGRGTNRQSTSVTKHKQKNISTSITNMQPAVNTSTANETTANPVISTPSTKGNDSAIEGEKEARSEHNFDSVLFYIGIEYECGLIYSLHYPQ